VTIETSARVAFLKKIHLFHGLDDDELQTIAEKLSEASHPAGAVIFEQDGKAESFYLIHGGSVNITRRQDGKQLQLAVFVKSDYFGELALVSNQRRSASATAVTDTTLLVLSRKDFEQLYKSDPKLRLNLEVAVRSRQLAQRLRFKWLRSDEAVYFLARKHPIVLYQKLIWPVLALFVPLFFFYAWYSIVSFAIVALAAWGSLIAIILWIAWLRIDWGNDYYIVTNQRVVWLEKVIGIYDSRQESPLGTTLSVGVETSQLGRILDYGDVIVRTWVGRIPFNNVSHPEQAQHMIEEHWHRTEEQAVGLEKEAMKDAIRRKLQLPLPPSGKPKADTDISSSSGKPAKPKPKQGRANLLRVLGANTLKLRYETGDSVFYRKHWFVLIQQAWMPLAGIIGVIVLFFWRLIRLAQLPEEAFVQIIDGKLVFDAYSLAFLIALVPFLGWLIYEVMDWSNDQFQVTPEQIVDLDKKPFGTQTRNAAQLESILGTEYRRIGILGEIFNYGTVYITVGGSKLAFEDVIDPASVQSDIDRRREARKAKQEEGKAAAERERMAEWLVTYHKNAEEFREEEKRNLKSE